MHKVNFRAVNSMTGGTFTPGPPELRINRISAAGAERAARLDWLGHNKLRDAAMRRPIAALTVFAATALLAGQATADPVEECRTRSANDQQRIACLEAAIRSMSGGTPTRAASSAAPQGLGAEQVAIREQLRGERPEPEREAFAAGIVAIEYDPTGRPTFTLDNGQVWRGLQPDPQYQRFKLPRHNRAEVWDAKISGYRLRVDGVKRILQVTRIK